MKSMFRLKKKKLNNKGMSLVEVLVAMIILTVTGVAFLQSFKYSFENNAKAKEKQIALTYAQSMMEAAKAYSVDELNLGKYKVLPATEYSATSTPLDKIYEYRLKKVNSKYNVIMKMTPSSSDGTNAKIVSDIYNIHNPNSTTDACLVQNIEDEQDKLLQYAWTQLLAQASSFDAKNGNSYLTDYMTYELGDYSFLNMSDCNIDSRTIKINANKNPAGIVAVTASVEYIYSVHMDYSYVDELGNHVNGSLSCDSITYTYNYNNFYANSDVKPPIKNVYVFYYPLYSGTDGFETLKYDWVSGSNDEIVINSNLDTYYVPPYGEICNVGFYLIKQKLPASTPTRQALMDAQLKGLEASYQVTVNQASTSNPINIYHNLNQSLYDAAHVAPIFNTYSGSKVYEHLLLKKESEPLVYNVVVEVNDLSGNNIYTLTGTTNAR